jgi:hypothetical protein
MTSNNCKCSERRTGRQTGKFSGAQQPQTEIIVDLDLELVSSGDKTALLALSTLEWLATTKSVLNEMGYKVHSAVTTKIFCSVLGAFSTRS